ncbi:Lar family restriction alleviation protein [Novosphingobium sp. MMS21-SN21R]
MPNPTHTPGELKACPICRDDPLIRNRGGAWGVNCAGSDPSHLIWVYGATEAEAITAWNTRTVDTELLEALKALVEIVDDQLCGDFPEPLQAARSAITKAEAGS